MKIHFVGIGGIGVSALAKYYLAKGHKITGSDLASSEITEDLKKGGIKITIGKNVIKKDADLIIYSPAAKLQYCKPKAISYPQALGELTKKHFTIAVSGTHGKSTTASMLGLLLVKAGLDPTVIVGTKLKEFGNSNCRVGKSKYLVIEADEHFASFLHYRPKIIILTNIEADHLDYYKNLKNILLTFKKYVSLLPRDGLLIANWDDKNIRKILAKSRLQIKKYSLKDKEAGKIKKILKVPGKHNVANALAALTATRTLKVPDKTSFKALAEYKGAWRRFEEKELKIKNRKMKIISDYAHHPTEVKATLEAAREKFSEKKIWCVFQPHQYQRTYYLFKDFVKVFKNSPVEKTIITDIYDVAGREEKKIKKKINSEKLTKAINKKETIYLPKERILNQVKNNADKIDVLIVMGAGNIYQILADLTKNIDKEKMNKKKKISRSTL